MARFIIMSTKFSDFIKTLALIRHQSSFHLDDVRHI